LKKKEKLLACQPGFELVRFKTRARSAFFALVVLAFWIVAEPFSFAQDWFKTGTGLGVEKARLAVPEFVARSTDAQPLEKVFHTVLWADLDYSGIIDLVSPSFYPLQIPSQPSELKVTDWAQPPANSYMVALGNLSVQGTSLAVAGYLIDVHNPSAPPVIQKIYHGAATEEDARRLAHQFADDIIAALSGGLPGIASTRIAFVRAAGGNKEIWVMDYDGANQHQLTHLRTVSLTPRWSPDASRIAFTCYEPFRGVVSAQICLYSMDLNRLVAFPRFRGTNSSPAWSPDGAHLAFMSSSQGSPEIFVADANGYHAHAVTTSRAVDTSPVWNPKTGQQIVFVSDRAGDPVLYTMNADGSNVQKIQMPDMGYVVDPSWSPNGQLLAFAWRRPTGNFDIYIMDIASSQLVELTRDEFRNERPSWAPDGRHLVFESTRTGSRQIWTMLADGSQPRQLTFQGENESPNWSPR
jgi:TolB protein